MHIYDITFYLKSGQSFTVVLESFQIQNNELGEIHSIDWKGAGGKLPNLKYIRLEDISAVVSAQHIPTTGGE